MPAPFQIIPATLAETEVILSLEQLCCPDPWQDRVIRPFIVAAGLPNKGYLARLLKEGDRVIAYAFVSRQEGQLLLERLGVHPEYRRKEIGSGLMASLIFAAQDWKLPVTTCSLAEDNLAGQLFLKYGDFKAVPMTEEARAQRAISVCEVSQGLSQSEIAPQIRQITTMMIRDAVDCGSGFTWQPGVILEL